MKCIFCAITSDKIPSQKIFETEQTLVFLDHSQEVDYHLLAIPKKHVKNILDCDKETLDQLMTTVQYVAKYCVDNLGFEGVDILSAAGTAAGQSIPHFHIHLILRKSGDGIDAWPRFLGAKLGQEEQAKALKISPISQ